MKCNALQCIAVHPYTSELIYYDLLAAVADG